MFFSYWSIFWDFLEKPLYQWHTYFSPLAFEIMTKITHFTFNVFFVCWSCQFTFVTVVCQYVNYGF